MQIKQRTSRRANKPGAPSDKVKFATQADPLVLKTLRSPAVKEGRQLQALIRDYLTAPDVLALHQTLVDRYGGACGVKDMEPSSFAISA
jgi:hypothetical protein